MIKEKILFCRGYEPERIYFYSKLIKKLQENYEVICLSTSLQEKKMFQKNGINSEFVKLDLESKNLTSQEVEEIGYFQKIFEEKNFRKINKKKLDKTILQLYKYYEDLDESYRFDKIILWGGIGSIVDSTLNYYIKKRNKKAYFLEDGYFRPKSLTCDTKGINYYNSVPRDIEFYKNYKFNELKVNSLSENKNVKYFKSNRFEKILDLLLKTNIEYSYVSPLTLFKSNLERKKILKNREIIEMRELPSEYIFIPFQLEIDTQFILFSPLIKSMKHLVESAQDAVKIYNKKNKKNMRIIFKIHPKDDILNIPEIIQIVDKKISDLITVGNTEKLIKNSKMVITINSTVGIEALSLEKKVLTLGKTFYNIEGIVKNCNKLENLAEDIKIVINSDFQKEIVDKFLNYLKSEYFLEVNWRKITDSEIKKFVKKIEDE